MTAQITCSSATFKFLLNKYPTSNEKPDIPFISPSKLDPLQSVLFSQFRKLKLYEKIEPVADQLYFEAQLPSGFVRENKTHIGKEGINFFENYIIGRIYEEMKAHVDKMRVHQVKKETALRNFCELNGYTEEDIKFETLVKQYQRYEISEKV